MNSKKGFITLTGGICFMICASATATVVADEVSTKDRALTVVEVIQDDKAPTVAEVSLVAKAPAVAQTSQHAMATLVAGVQPMPTLADIWDKNKCFVVLLGHCL